MANNFTVVIPFFNESATLESAVLNLIQENFADEIILINDGSSDASKEIALNLVEKFSFIKLINSKQNKGKGKAVQLGIEGATGQYVGILDADLEYSPSDLKFLFENISKNQLDLVSGSRFIGEINRSNLYLRTYLANKFLSQLFSKIHNKKVTDIATCLKVFNRKIFENFNLESSDFSIEVELIAKSLNISDQFKEYPITYNARSYEEGKKIKIKDGLIYIFKIFKYKFQNGK